MKTNNKDKKIESEELNIDDKLNTSELIELINYIPESEELGAIIPKGKNEKLFTEEEAATIAEYIFFKSPNIRLKAYKRAWPKGIPLRRRRFLKYLFGEANCNAAKAARMAGYSPRSAKQIAYKIIHQSY